MRKITFSILLLFLGINIGKAQHLRVEVGTKVKALNKISELGNIPIKELPIHATIGIEFSLGEHLYLETEASFTKQNLSITDLAENKPAFSKLGKVLPPLNNKELIPRYYSSSIKVPINIGFRVRPIGDFALSLEAGPYILFNLNSEFGYQGQDKLNLTKIKKDIQGSDFVSKREYGLNLATALTYSKLSLRLGLEYNLSDKLNFDKAFKENIEAIRPLFKQINKERLSYYLTLGFTI